MKVTNSIPNNLKTLKELYGKCNFILTHPKLNSESVEYGACSFELNGKTIQYRVSKITPTKTGQFVTIWKRNKDGVTEPFNISDNLDFIIITSKSGENFGQFIFPKSVLADKGIITKDGNEGKRGIRVYPPWDTPTNKQAEITQSWHKKYFIKIENDHSTDFEMLRRLLMST